MLIVFFFQEDITVSPAVNRYRNVDTCDDILEFAEPYEGQENPFPRKILIPVRKSISLPGKFQPEKSPQIS